jgi:hyperosmotically inducible periplasmic protein
MACIADLWEEPSQMIAIDQIRKAGLILAMSGWVSFAAPSPQTLAPSASKYADSDLSSSILTADQQRNNKSDLQLAKAVRKAVMAEAGLSVYAQNIKIIAHDGVVTLRGPVRSESEKNRIGRLAWEAGAKGLDNMLQINPGQ